MLYLLDFSPSSPTFVILSHLESILLLLPAMSDSRSVYRTLVVFSNSPNYNTICTRLAARSG